jgi:hypothetical protein
MMWTSILLSGWLTLAWLPSGGLALYDKPVPEYVALSGSFYTELGAEATWGLFFASGSVKTPMWWNATTSSFWPFQAEYTVDAGMRWKDVRLGWMHTCYHPVVPDMALWQWAGRQVTPRWEGAYDAVYLTIGRRP